jgi:hypothetical protein
VQLIIFHVFAGLLGLLFRNFMCFHCRTESHQHPSATFRMKGHTHITTARKVHSQRTERADTAGGNGNFLNEYFCCQ